MTSPTGTSSSSGPRLPPPRRSPFPCGGRAACSRGSPSDRSNRDFFERRHQWHRRTGCRFRALVVERHGSRGIGRFISPPGAFGLARSPAFAVSSSFLTSGPSDLAFVAIPARPPGPAPDPRGPSRVEDEARAFRAEEPNASSDSARHQSGPARRRLETSPIGSPSKSAKCRVRHELTTSMRTAIRRPPSLPCRRSR